MSAVKIFNDNMIQDEVDWLKLQLFDNCRKKNC